MKVISRKSYEEDEKVRVNIQREYDLQTKMTDCENIVQLYGIEVITTSYVL